MEFAVLALHSERTPEGLPTEPKVTWGVLELRRQRKSSGQHNFKMNEPRRGISSPSPFKKQTMRARVFADSANAAYRSQVPFRVDSRTARIVLSTASLNRKVATSSGSKTHRRSRNEKNQRPRRLKE